MGQTFTLGINQVLEVALPMADRTAPPDNRFTGVRGTNAQLSTSSTTVKIPREFTSGHKWDDFFTLSKAWQFTLDALFKRDDVGYKMLESAVFISGNSEKLFIRWYPSGKHDYATYYQGEVSAVGYVVDAPADGEVTAQLTLKGRGKLYTGKIGLISAEAFVPDFRSHSIGNDLRLHTLQP